MLEQRRWPGKVVSFPKKKKKVARTSGEFVWAACQDFWWRHTLLVTLLLSVSSTRQSLRVLQYLDASRIPTTCEQTEGNGS